VSNECKSADATLVLCHHFSGGHRYTKRPMTLGAEQGAGFREWTRQYAYIGQRCKYKQNPRRHYLTLNFGGSGNIPSFWHADIDEDEWHIKLVNKCADEEPEKTPTESGNADARRVLEWLRDSEPAPKTQIRESIYPSMSGSRVNSALACLMKDGLAGKRTEKRGGRTREVYYATV